MAFGTTSVVITATGGPLDIDITGLDVMDMTSTTVIVDDLVTVTANNFDTEVVTLSTVGGAAAVLETQATLASLRTTSAHPLELGANSITGLTIATDGKVELDVVGTATNHLIDKGYVDTQVTAVLTGILGLAATAGNLRIPNNSGNDIIINWGVTASLANSTEVVTFTRAFPSAFFVGFATKNQAGLGDQRPANVSGGGLTTMSVHNAGPAPATINWLAIGF
jgi:hypothetical protein